MLGGRRRDLPPHLCYRLGATENWRGIIDFRADQIVETDLTERNIADLLTRAVELLNRNQPEQAELLLGQILASQPQMPQALMLSGMVRLLQNHNEEAETLLRRALSHSPGQPAVLFHLASALRAQGKRNAAIDAYRQALNRNPRYAEAHLALAATLREAGDLVGAETAYRALLRLEPHATAARAGLGAVLNALERPDETEVLLEATVAGTEDPTARAELDNVIGEAKMLQRRPAEALAHFDHAIEAAPHFLAAEKNRATALELLRDGKAAAAAYRRVLARDPLDLKTHLLLNELLHRSGDSENFLHSYDEAVNKPTPLLATAKADHLLKMGRAVEAHDAYHAALAMAPADVAAHIGLGRALTAIGGPARALHTYETGLQRHPDDADLQTAFAYCLLENADPRRAQRLAEQAVAQQPHSQAALAVLGLCYRANKDSRDDAFNGFETLVRVFDLDPPEGYGDGTQFSAALEAHVDTLHAGSREFFSQTLRGGTRSFEEFFAYRHDLRRALRQRIDQALGDYISAMAGPADHPFVGRRGNGFSYSGSWSSRMQAGGFHLNHIHSAWISSVYYVAVPDGAPGSQEGWLKFGEPSRDVRLPDPVRRTVQPKPGRLVLFPSYMWHGTIAFSAPGPRTTIAFDAVPR